MATRIAQGPSTRRDQLDVLLLRAFDGLLVGILLVAPLFMGGRHPVGELVYVAMVAAAIGAWCVRAALGAKAPWRLSGVEWLLAAAVALLAVQIVALPAPVLAKIAPLGGQLLPLWSGGSGEASLGEWSTVSLTPQATRGQFVILLAHVMLFLVVVQRIQSVDDVERLLRWIAVAVMVMAAIGLLQLLFCNKKFLWIYEHPSRTTEQAVRGMFANPNHLASFLALGVAPLIAWIAGCARPQSAHGNPARSRRASGSRWRGATGASQGAQGDPRQLALLVGAGVVAFAGLLTFSRGGVLVLVLAAAIATLLCVRLGALGRWSLVGLGVAALVVVGALGLFGYQPLARQMETLGSGEIDEIDPHTVRLSLWAADVQAFSHSPLLGAGAGSHAEVYPTFLATYVDKEFTHAESGYVHLLLETGAIGALIAVALLCAALRWAGGTFFGDGQGQVKACAAAVLTGLIVSAVHSIWDFVWFIPACMSMTIVLAACGCRLWQLSRQRRDIGVGGAASATPREFALSGFAWSIAAILLAGVGVLMVVNRTGPALAASGWERFLALRRAETELGEEVTADVLMDPLADAIEHDPDNARLNLRMAAVCIRRFEFEQSKGDVPMPLAQIRDAARASAFADKAQQDAWINRITGENRKWLDLGLFYAHRALRLCPLQGEGYTVLAELSFLQGPQAFDQSRLIDQALRVRPNDAHVLYAAGRDAALAGDDERAIALWRKAFQREPKYRALIIAAVAPQIPAEEFLRHFTPNAAQSRELLAFYRDRQMAEPAAVVARHLIGQLKDEAAHAPLPRGARLWNDAHALCADLGDDSEALACIERAVAADPLSYDYHRSLAKALLAVGQNDRAIAQLHWCRQHRSGDPAVERLLELARRGTSVEPLKTAAGAPTGATRR